MLSQIKKRYYHLPRATLPHIGPSMHKVKRGLLRKQNIPEAATQRRQMCRRGLSICHTCFNHQDKIARVNSKPTSIYMLPARRSKRRLLKMYSLRWCSGIVGDPADWNSLPIILGLLPPSQKIDKFIFFTKFPVQKLCSK